MNLIVVGAGLSGLLIAHRLLDELTLKSLVVIESRNRVGGRTMSSEEGVSLGAAWAWPSSHKKVMNLANELGVESKKDDEDPFDEKVRFKGGVAQLSIRLAEEIEKKGGQILLGKRVVKVEETDDQCESSEQFKVHTDDGTVHEASVLVLALPPPQMLSIAPNSLQGRALLEAQPVWMAGLAKLIFFYSSRFWAGQMPRINSRGPIVQIYDSSSFDRSKAALGTFVAYYGEKDEQRIIAQSKEHLRSFFPPSLRDEAAEPTAVRIHAWFNDKETCLEEDPSQLNFNHPHPLPNFPIRQGKSGSLFLAGTELAPFNPGMLEGAIESAEVVLKEFKKNL